MGAARGTTGFGVLGDGDMGDGDGIVGLMVVLGGTVITGGLVVTDSVKRSLARIGGLLTGGIVVI